MTTRIGDALDIEHLADGQRLTGADLAELDEDDFRTAVREHSVFARVAPEHELRIVEALQDEDQIVAMTSVR